MPPLGFIPSPSANGFYVGPFFVHAYGIAYVFAVIAAILITSRRWEALGGHRELVQECALWGFPAGVIGGRLYFDITSWNLVPPHWWGPFAVWDGGLGIWGGIALGSAAGILVLRRRGANVPLFMDCVAPGAARRAVDRTHRQLLQPGALRRPHLLPWGLEISRAHRPAGYLNYATFQPTFLYEIIWNLRSRRRSCGSGTTAASARRACSRCTSPATRLPRSSRSHCGSTPRTTSSGCG